MRAIIIEQYGGPEQLAIRENPDPVPLPGHVVIQVKAFGLNHAEIYFRKGVWGGLAYAPRSSMHIGKQVA